MTKPLLLLGIVVLASASGANDSAGQNPDTPARSASGSAQTENAGEWGREFGAAVAIDYLALQESLSQMIAGQADPAAGRFIPVRGASSFVDAPGDFIAALSRASKGDTVFVPGDALLDLTPYTDIVVPAGVVVASSRRVNGSEGALLYTGELGTTLFRAQAGAKLVGLSILGPDTDRRTVQLERLKARGGNALYYAVPVARGIVVEGSDVVIENCEIWGWSRAGVEVTNGAQNVVVRHNLIYLNQRRGLGYGVFVDAAEAIVEYNLFDWCRHCVAGSGRPGTSYEARYNFVLTNMSGHTFDMHGGVDRGDDTNIAGTRIKIHHNNVAQTTFPSVVIRGEPEEYVEIYQNQFRSPDAAAQIEIHGSRERVRIFENSFGGRPVTGP